MFQSIVALIGYYYLILTISTYENILVAAQDAELADFGQQIKVLGQVSNKPPTTFLQQEY